MAQLNSADDKNSAKAETAGFKAMANVHSSLIMDRRARRLSEHIAELLPESARVLDVGAGNGKLGKAICDLRPDVYIEGVDIMLWPERFIPLLQFDGNTIPAEDASWDVCLISDVLHHCDDPDKLLIEMNRVAKSSIIIKDHIANNRFDFGVLRFMDWFGNRGHGVVLPYNFWPWKKWQETFDELNLEVDVLNTKLGLYPPPFSLLFDRKLHFVVRLTKRS